MSLIKLNNNAVKNITSVGSVGTGDLVFISSATASSSASIEFDLGSYKEYKFFFVNMHPANNTPLKFNLSTDNGSNYNVTKTTTAFTAYHNEGDTDTLLGYQTAHDLAQSTSDQRITIFNIKNNNDSSMSGYLHLFNPSSTTYVKHFMSVCNYEETSQYSINDYIAGYANTTSPLTNIIFRMDSGNIDSGDILLYGVN